MDRLAEHSNGVLSTCGPEKWCEGLKKVSYVWQKSHFQHQAWTIWPSGLRRQLQVLVRKGVGSNPTVVTHQLVKAPSVLFHFAGGHTIRHHWLILQSRMTSSASV